MQFTKLFSSILDSTIWQESPETKIVWVTLLAMSDRNGEVYASIPGLAARAKVSIQDCESALACFMAPDRYSRTTDHEGRRLEAIDGGWVLLNHAKYRALLSSEERKEYNRRKQAEFRENKRKASLTVNDKSIVVIENKQCQHSTEAEAEAIDREREPQAPVTEVEAWKFAKNQPVIPAWTEQSVAKWFATRSRDGWQTGGQNPKAITAETWRSDLRASHTWATSTPPAPKNGTQFKPKRPSMGKV